MMRSLTVALLAGVASAHTAKGPGTETILLIKGGYGPGVDLLGTTSRTHHKSAHQAAEAKTPAEKKEAQLLANATKTASFLAQELQAATRTTSSVMQEDEQMRVEKADLQSKVASDQRQLQKAEESSKAQKQLLAQVQRLQQELVAAQKVTAQEHMRAEAYKSKAQSLEKDIHLLSKSWKNLAAHEAHLARAVKKPADKPAQPPAHKVPTVVAAAKAPKVAVAKVTKTEDADDDSSDDADDADDATDAAADAKDAADDSDADDADADTDADAEDAQ